MPVLLPASIFRAVDPTCLTPWGWGSRLPLPDDFLPILLARPDSEGDPIPSWPAQLTGLLCGCPRARRIFLPMSDKR